LKVGLYGGHGGSDYAPKIARINRLRKPVGKLQTFAEIRFIVLQSFGYIA
jgi:hypothetical protein